MLVTSACNARYPCSQGKPGCAKIKTEQWAPVSLGPKQQKATAVLDLAPDHYNLTEGCSLSEIVPSTHFYYPFDNWSSIYLLRDRTAGPIDSYHEWFRIAMTKWLDLAKLKAIKRIKKAVELDEVG